MPSRMPMPWRLPTMASRMPSTTAPATRPTRVGRSAGSSRMLDSSDCPALTALSRSTLLANRSHSSSVTASPAATPRTVAAAGPPARLMPMGTHNRTRNSVPCRMPQAMEPKSHSPRNRNVPMAMSSSATTTNEIAPRTSATMMPRSRPVTASSALSRSMCAWASPRALTRTRPIDSLTPGAPSVPFADVSAPLGSPVGAAGPGRSVSGDGVPGSVLRGTSARIGGRLGSSAARMRIAVRARQGHIRRTGRPERDHPRDR